MIIFYEGSHDSAWYDREFMKKVYDLKMDRALIQAIQSATLKTRDHGLRPIHGLFGSQQWWDAIHSGLIPLQTMCGVITNVYMAGHNDFPMVEVMDDQVASQWERKSLSPDEDCFYKIGRKIRMEYVTEEFKRPSTYTGKYTKTVLAIWVCDMPED